MGVAKNVAGEPRLFHISFSMVTDDDAKYDGACVVAAETLEDAEDLAHDQVCEQLGIVPQLVRSFIVDHDDEIVLTIGPVLSTLLWEAT